ncbi:MAG: GerAB/ArcD/ProY family transporter, partial [Oscillospiraceae bacterium]|nr:GerAB/ArcD/ProY family transporter [Oscillospiraceae bacterium]
MAERAPLSRWQFTALLWAAMVSPAIRQIPGAALGAAGSAAWLSAALCLPAAAALGGLFGRLLDRRRDGEGLAALLCRALGAPVGRAVCGLWGLWTVFYGGFVLRAGADRFVSAVYNDSPEWLFMGVTLLLCLPAARGRVRVLGRCAEILAPLLWAVFALVFLLGFKNVDAACLRLPDSQPVGRALAGMLPLTAALCSAVHLGFLADTAEQDKLAGPCAKAMAALGALGLLLSVTVLGTFGAELSGKINYPFFVMIRSLRILHLIERMEALVVAQWVAADYLLLSALLRSAARALTAA